MTTHLVKNILLQKRSAITILTSSVILGIVYPYFADRPDDSIARINGLLIGLFGGTVIITYELHLFYFPKRIYSFTFILISKILAYTLSFILIIILTVSTTRSIEAGQAYLSYIQSKAFIHFLLYEDFNVISGYTLTCVAFVITTRQISRKMGPGELFNYIIGKYHKPKREHRIFLAVDLKGSTTLAEQLGELKYHEFLKQYFYDLTQSIAIHEGKIYRYVGDQVVISWLLADGLKNNNAVFCFFRAEQILNNQKEFYIKHYGIEPKFRAVLDMGEVLTAEIGLDKQQLVFYGDVVERLASMEKACKKENQDLLLSEYIAIPLKQSKGLEFLPCTTMTDSSNNKIELFKVRQTKAKLNS